MKLLLLATALLMASCAIPVRPIAYIAPDETGALHFVPDKDQEPHVNPAVIAGIGGALGGLGEPWTSLLVGAVSAITAGVAGHVQGKKKGKKATAAVKAASSPIVQVI